MYGRRTKDDQTGSFSKKTDMLAFGGRCQKQHHHGTAMKPTMSYLICINWRRVHSKLTEGNHSIGRQTRKLISQNLLYLHHFPVKSTISPEGGGCNNGKNGPLAELAKHSRMLLASCWPFSPHFLGSEHFQCSLNPRSITGFGNLTNHARPSTPAPQISNSLWGRGPRVC